MLPTNPLLNATAPAGPHLAVALLRQYAAGTLAPAAQHRVEAHTLACARCADILEGLLQTPPTTTDQALAQLQQRLRQRVQQQAAPARPLLKPRTHRWLALQLAAAAALLLGLVAGGWWAWQQRHLAPAGLPAARTTTAPRPPAALATPVPATSSSASPAAASPAAVAVASPAGRPHHARRAPVVRQTQPLASRAPKAAAVDQPLAAANALDKAVPDGVAPGRAISAAPPSAPLASAAAKAAPDSAGLARRAGGIAVPDSRSAFESEAAKVRASAMPAAPGLPPTPVGGYAAWREQLRHDAADFKPELPDRPLSGTVQLRLTIGADGKIQEMRVVHGLRADYDAEAQRLVCEGPAWVPGISGGKRAARTIDVAVPF